MFKLSLVALTLFIALPLNSTAEPEKQSTHDPHMAAFIKASTPGKEHEVLKRFVGEWQHTISWWMSAEAPPEVSQGTSSIESIFGGRFIRQHVKGTSMGQPFEGLGVTGYDNVQRQFTSIWLDNMSTAIMTGHGQFDASKNAIVDKGSFSCPLSKDGTREYRAIWHMPQNDSFRYEMFVPDENGKEYRMMEIVYRRSTSR